MTIYVQPETLDEALEVLAQGPVTVAAGCTDLFPATGLPMLGGPVLGGPVLDITRIRGLRGIEQTAQGWRIGAATTWTDLVAADLPPAFDMLKMAAREVGSIQIQNSATLAGNICNASPAADGAPPLLALDAAVELGSANGRRSIPLGAFLTGPRQTDLRPGEMMTAVTIPAAAASGRSAFCKLGARKYLVISIAMVAVRLAAVDGRVRDIAVSVGSCSPVAQRLTGLEQVLNGLPVSELADAVTPDLVSEKLQPIADIRASAEYRLTVAETLICRMLAGLGAEVRK